MQLRSSVSTVFVAHVSVITIPKHQKWRCECAAYQRCNTLQVGKEHILLNKHELNKSLGINGTYQRYYQQRRV